MVTAIARQCVGTDVTFKYVGKSTDEKPISTNGSIFNELDTGKEYFFDGDEQGWSEQADKYLDSLIIETAPTKTTYYVGDKFDATGAVTKAVYTDESDKVVDFVVDAPEKLELDSVVALAYTENGRTRKAPVEIEIKSNEAKDAESFVDIMSNGSEVVLEADVEVSKIFTLNNDFVLDLNGHEIVNNATARSGKKVDCLINANGCELTLKGEGKLRATSAKMRVAEAVNGGSIVVEGGKYTSDKEVAIDARGEGSKITMNDGEIVGREGGLMAFEGASIEVNGGKVVATDNFPIGTNGSDGQGNNTIVINGGYLEGHIVSPTYEAIGIYIANNDTFIMNDGEVFVENGAGLLMRGGNVTFNGGSIRCTGIEGGGGFIGDQKTVMSQSAIIYDEKSDYPGKKGMQLTVNGGTFVGYDKSIDVQSNEVEPKVYVYGGAFVPPYVPAD